MPLPLLNENQIPERHHSAEKNRRRNVLRDTVEKLSMPDKRQQYYDQARANHEAWKKDSALAPCVVVERGDWGETAKKYSQATGKIYAVLNMASGTYPGGGYRFGAAAQEENMFRRTDCHFYIDISELETNGTYNAKLSGLINGVRGKVYLDLANPRVCIKGPESQRNEDGFGHGYEDLPAEDFFLFYELRSAADNLTQTETFNEASMRRKIRAQLDTLKANNIRHVILSAFGCGAFGNPPEKVAYLYKEELLKDAGCFDSVVFAIYVASHIDNFPIFNQILDKLPLTKKISQGQSEECKRGYQEEDELATILISKDIEPGKIIAAINLYLTERDSHLNCFSFWADYQRGLKRAECYRALFGEYNENQAVCALLVYCLLASYDGSNLKKYVLEALAFDTQPEALAFFMNKLKVEYNLYSTADLKIINHDIIGSIVRLMNTHGTTDDIQPMIKKFMELISQTNAEKAVEDELARKLLPFSGVPSS